MIANVWEEDLEARRRGKRGARRIDERWWPIGTGMVGIGKGESREISPPILAERGKRVTWYDGDILLLITNFYVRKSMLTPNPAHPNPAHPTSCCPPQVLRNLVPYDTVMNGLAGSKTNSIFIGL
jgi:hypothetical protein